MAYDTWAVQRGLNAGFVAIKFNSATSAMQTSESMSETEVTLLLESWSASSSDIAQALQKAKNAAA